MHAARFTTHRCPDDSYSSVTTLGSTRSSESVMRRGRSIHLIDLENFIGDPSASSREITIAWRAYKSHVGIGSDDIVYIGCSHYLAKRALFAIGNEAQFLIRSGRDGGETVLLESITPQWAARRFHWVVVASGDHLFHGWIRQAHSLGMSSFQVARRQSSSSVLRSVVTCRMTLDVGRILQSATPAVRPVMEAERARRARLYWSTLQAATSQGRLSA